eukprot:12010034-Prorocentrum_lima.AAC.1
MGTSTVRLDVERQCTWAAPPHLRAALPPARTGEHGQSASYCVCRPEQSIRESALGLARACPRRVGGTSLGIRRNT